MRLYIVEVFSMHFRVFCEIINYTLKNNQQRRLIFVHTYQNNFIFACNS